jgi:hypothetical protein
MKITFVFFMFYDEHCQHGGHATSEMVATLEGYWDVTVLNAREPLIIYKGRFYRNWI